MKLNIKITPTVSKNTTKKLPTGYSIGSSTNGVKWGYFNDRYAIGFVYHKVNPKLKSQKKVKKVWNGKEVTTTVRKYEPGYWVISQYQIPLDLLKLMNLELNQKSRHFILTTKQK